MKRRNFLKSVFVAGVVAQIPNYMLVTSCRSRDKRPSFIIFLSDDLGYGDLACYGNPIIETPHIDKFAQEGMRFTDFHSASTVCSPSRASLLTGRNHYRVGIYYLLGGGAHLRKDEITIASLLRKQGYDTCFVGKWHLSQIDKEDSNQPTPGDHGFDHWFATKLNSFTNPLKGPQNPNQFIRNGIKVGEVRGWYCDIIVREAIDWLRKRANPQKPFFLLVCSHEPHTPLNPPEKYAEMYDNEKVDQLEKTIHYGEIKRPKRNISHSKRYYYGTVSQLDDAFGTLMKAVDEMNIKENTIVFFTSDNGPETPITYSERGGQWEDRCFGTPGPWRGMKRFTYEGGHRIPGIVRWPGHIKPGSVSDELVNGTDFLPTLCELAQIEIPKDRIIDGANIVPAFKGQQIRREIPACWIFPAGYTRIPHIAMREKNYVLLGWFNSREEDELWMDYIMTARIESFELYNLAEDVSQSKNLVKKDPMRFKDMADKIKILWKEIQAEGPVWKEWKSKDDILHMVEQRPTLGSGKD